MNIESTPRFASQAGAPRVEARRGTKLQLSLFAAALSLSGASHAIDFGPNGMFSLTGFAEATTGMSNNYCGNCQWTAFGSKDQTWGDALAPGREYKTVSTMFYQVQPYLGAKYDLGNGFKLSGLLSQRYRDGVVDGNHVETRYGGLVDVPGFWYQKNASLSHEDWGTLRIGAMTTRGWSVADYPYGTNVGMSYEWGSSGSGYGMLSNAVSYTSRILDFANGDLVLEATYDKGNELFKINKPRFIELYAQFHKGDLVVDAMAQDARNGTPSAWGHGPFTGLTPFAVDDALLKGSSQNMAMIMARYQIDSKLEISGGLRRNHWSGANAVITQPGVFPSPTGPKDNWNNMFNVDWGGTLNGVSNPGYAATSYDLLLGARYRMGKWIASAGMVHLGTASTDNPSERGQSNSALFNTLGLNYEYGGGLILESSLGMMHYARKGLSPMSMPGNSAFSNVDSRVNRDGNWFTVGAVYAF